MTTVKLKAFDNDNELEIEVSIATILQSLDYQIIRIYNVPLNLRISDYFWVEVAEDYDPSWLIETSTRLEDNSIIALAHVGYNHNEWL